MSCLATTSLIPMPTDPAWRTAMGILAAAGSMACWVFTSLSFTTAGKRFGSTSVNVVRSVLAALILVAVVWSIGDAAFPFPSDSRLWLLGVSGVFGLAVGDQLIFSAFNRIGPRITLLILNLVPVLTALIAWPGLGEELAPIAWFGILMTLVGVGWVLADGQPPASERDGYSRPRLGLWLALFGVLSVSIGNVLAKHGMLVPSVSVEGGPPQTEVGPLVAQEIRMLFGAAAIVLLLGFARITGQAIGTPPTDVPEAMPRRSTAMAVLLLGTVLGPILGMILFLYSALLVKLAVTTTILALTPVAVLPFNRLVDRTPITRRALAGAILGVIGVTILAFAEPGKVDPSASQPQGSVPPDQPLHSMP